jgi:hypothetical protein
LFVLSLGLSLFAAPLARAEDEMIENPTYAAWAKHKAGTSVTATGENTVAGQNMSSETTTTLLEITPEKAVVEVAMAMKIPGFNAPPQTVKQEVPAKIKKAADAPAGKAPEDAKVETKDLGTEKVEISGKTYECKVTESHTEANGMKMTTKMWATPEIPGGMAKMETKGEGDQPMNVKMTVTKIETK